MYKTEQREMDLLEARPRLTAVNQKVDCDIPARVRRLRFTNVIIACGGEMVEKSFSRDEVETIFWIARPSLVGTLPPLPRNLYFTSDILLFSRSPIRFLIKRFRKGAAALLRGPKQVDPCAPPVLETVRCSTGCPAEYIFRASWYAK